jgi:hypothetical protein
LAILNLIMTQLILGRSKLVASAINSVSPSIPLMLSKILAKQRHPGAISPHFFSSKNPPPRSGTDSKEPEKESSSERKKNSAENTSRFKTNTKQRFKEPPRKEWTKKNRYQSHNSKLQVPVVKPSEYYYYRPSNGTNGTRVALPAVDASALLDPRTYCKSSANVLAGNAAVTHGVSKSISGTDAARRLLRGKKEFVNAVRSQLLDGHADSDKGGNSSGVSNQNRSSHAALLEGTNVPHQLFQHAIDMADALLVHYGNAAECTFHNYYQQPTSTPGQESSRLLPQVIRIRSRNSTNRCSPWPPSTLTAGEPSSNDWNQNLALYLTVMERIACKLGVVLKREPTRLPGTDQTAEDDDDELTSSPLLFPTLAAQWNVDVLRGSYYDVHTTTGIEGETPPVPIVEWTRSNSSTMGHVLIRLQGHATEDNGLPGKSPSGGSQRGPVTLVFDACFRNELL